MTKLFVLVSIICLVAVAGCASENVFRDTRVLSLVRAPLPTRFAFGNTKQFSMSDGRTMLVSIPAALDIQPASADTEQRFCSVSNTEYDEAESACIAELFENQCRPHHDDLDWIYRQVGNQICLNPKVLGMSSPAVGFSSELENKRVSYLANNPFLDLTSNGYCWKVLFLATY